MARNGVWCAVHGQFEFKDAKWEANEHARTWFWFCPIEGCGAVLGVDPYNPPADTPTKRVFTSSQPDAETPQNDFRGIGIPDRGLGRKDGLVSSKLARF